MSDEKRNKYEKPMLAPLGDDKGELSEKDLRDVTGGTTTSLDDCRSGGSAVVTCLQGGCATATCSGGSLQQ